VGDVLVVNAGSTSLKLYQVSQEGEATRMAGFDDVDASGLDCVAHRVVHGGPRFRDPVVVDDDVRAQLERLEPLAPLHNAPALRDLDAARARLPGLPHVAVFDTAFHATIPPAAATYAVPRRWREEWGVRRYGFHGLSVQACSERVRVARLVVCHLGGGCSVTAVLDGRSVDTTMGFSPLEGVPMATRAGTIDPEILLYLQRHAGLGPDELEHALEHESGLLALGGSTRVEELEASSEPAAELALSVFCYRVAAAVGALAAALGGLDALVFTGGVGERASEIRTRTADGLRFLGVEIDPARDAAAAPDAEVSAAGAAVHTLVVGAREDLEMTRQVRACL
jgi:acetate kinase